MSYATMELERAGLFDADSDYNGGLGKAVLELVEVFEKQGHSGASAVQTVKLFSTVALHQPLQPISGDSDEWVEVAEGQVQNKRCSAIFKEGANGKAYYLDAICWRSQSGSTFSSGKSREGITGWQFIKSFPFVPKTFVIDVIEEEVAPGDWEFTIKDPNQLKEVWEYYGVLNNKEIDA